MLKRRICSVLVLNPNAPSSFALGAKCGPALLVQLQTHGYGLSALPRGLTGSMMVEHPLTSLRSHLMKSYHLRGHGG